MALSSETSTNFKAALSCSISPISSLDSSRSNSNPNASSFEGCTALLTTKRTLPQVIKEEQLHFRPVRIVLILVQELELELLISTWSLRFI